MSDNSMKDGGAWTGFLVAAFGVVGMVGMYATFAAQIPLDRALARSAALDQALVAMQGPDAAAALEKLRPALGDSADTVIAGRGDAVPADATLRIDAERTRVLAAFKTESADIGFRLRIVIAAFTFAAALFGTAVLSVVRRAAR